MLSRFYQRYSRVILWVVVLSFPWLALEATSVPSNNDIETWLPHHSAVRSAYEQFKRDFGVEEIVVIGIERNAADEALVDAICGRIDRLPGVRKCWSASRLKQVMGELGVTEAESSARLDGLTGTSEGDLQGLMVLLSDAGIRNRAATVNDIRGELDYCRLNPDQLCISGGPVIITELDRLGGTEENTKFFLFTLVVCLGLLYYWIRDWKLSLSVLALTIWAINVTMTIFKHCGGQMNFILGALSVMVMVFTLEASIHVIHYYRASRTTSDPLGEALRLCWKPCLVSMFTTTVGLFAVSVTDILPVTQFGYASSLGAVVAMLAGLAITPAILTVLPTPEAHAINEGGAAYARLGSWLIAHRRGVIAASCGLTVAGFLGLTFIRTKIDPLDFLPHTGRVIADVKRIQKELTDIDSIEAVVDFGTDDLPFLQKLRKVRELEQVIRQHPAVRHTMSAGAFFPENLPESPLALMQLLQRADSRRGSNEFLVGEEQLWRISARVRRTPGVSISDVHRDLERMTAGQPVHFTGIATLLEQAQEEIFQGFWKSFASAFVVIGGVMAIALRSIRITVLAMVPNLLPLGIVFGCLGWCQVPVDISMMMTGSIALGISIDGTFHFLVRYREQCHAGKSNPHAVRIALMTTGGPILESIVVSSIGMLAMTLSSFAPTVRFGLLMAALLLATLAGDLLLLPALLAGRRLRKPAAPAALPVRNARAIPANHLPALTADRVA